MWIRIRISLHAYSAVLRIQIRMDPELLPGSGTRNLQSWIRIRNKSFRIRNTGIRIQRVKNWPEKNVSDKV